MRNEQDVPDGVRKVVEGVPYCPNCSVAMRPIASVDTTERPKTGISAAMTLEQIAAKVVEINHEAIELGKELKDAAEAHKDAKKAYDAKLVTLSLAVERLGRVMGGEQIQADRPLLDLAEEEPEPPAVTDPRCLCTHSQSLHTEANGCAVCVCELFELPEDSQEPASESAMGAAVRLAAEEIRQQLAQRWIVVDVETITGWTLEQYDQVVAYLSAIAVAPPMTTVAEPDFLPEGVPDHVQALHAALGEAAAAVTLADVCAWTQAQRDIARTWANQPNGPGHPGFERPDFIPAPLGEEPEEARVVPRRRARKVSPVAAT